MRIGRLILVVATLVTILVFPLLIKDAVQALRLPSAYAAPSFFDPDGRVYQNGNNDPNNDDDDDDGDDGDDNDDESDNEGEDDDDDGNDNVECFLNLNDNEPVPCDFENDNNPSNNNNGNFDGDNGDTGDNNDNGDGGGAPAPAPSGGFVPPAHRCFDVQEVGDVRLILEGGSITVQVVPPVGFAQRTYIDLDDVEDLNTVPAPPAGSTFLDHLVWRMKAGTPCDGPEIGTLSNAVNLGIPYSVSANKSKLQIVILKNGAWVEIPTTPDPDPNNPYISATITETGTYAVIQKP